MFRPQPILVEQPRQTVGKCLQLSTLSSTVKILSLQWRSAPNAFRIVSPHLAGLAFHSPVARCLPASRVVSSGFPEVLMSKRLLPALAAVFLATVFVQPDPCQDRIHNSKSSELELTAPHQIPPPISLAQASPPPPFDPQVVDTIRKTCCRLTGHIQISFSNGVTWTGTVPKLLDPDSFDFRRRGYIAVQRLSYRDVRTAMPIPPNVPEVALEGAEFTGIGLLFVIAFPFFFLWGLSCNFSCS
jgi:hypothetical protein